MLRRISGDLRLFAGRRTQHRVYAETGNYKTWRESRLLAIGQKDVVDTLVHVVDALVHSTELSSHVHTYALNLLVHDSPCSEKHSDTSQVRHPAEPDPRMDETGVLCSA